MRRLNQNQKTQVAEPMQPWREEVSWKAGEFIDGNINLRGDNAIGAAGLINLASWYSQHCELNPSNEEFVALCFTIGSIIQSALTKTCGHADIGSAAHVRARGLLRDVLVDAPPIPYDTNEASVRKWLAGVTKLLTQRLELLVLLCGAEREPVDFLAHKPWLKLIEG